MTSRFCIRCHRIMDQITTPETYLFKCRGCNYELKPNEQASQVYERIGGKNDIYSKILANASKDPMNPKVRVKCINCDSDIVKQVRLGEDMLLINACVKCHKQWLHS